MDFQIFKRSSAFHLYHVLEPFIFKISMNHLMKLFGFCNLFAGFRRLHLFIKTLPYVINIFVFCFMIYEVNSTDRFWILVKCGAGAFWAPVIVMTLLHRF